MITTWGSSQEMWGFSTIAFLTDYMVKNIQIWTVEMEKVSKMEIITIVYISVVI